MKYVYILQSRAHPDKHYIGIADDPYKRLELHNTQQAQSRHTAMYGPWDLTVEIGFTDDKKAHAFERYLKTGSGRAFSKRHL